MKRNYKIKYTFSSRDDMRNMKKYILENFKYRELGENFTQKMKKATNGLKTLPTGYDTVDFQYRGYEHTFETVSDILVFLHSRRTNTDRYHIACDAEWHGLAVCFKTLVRR